LRERKFTLAIALVIIITIGTFAYFSERNEWEPSPHETSYMDYLPEVITSLPEDFYPAGHTRDDLLKVLPQAVEKTGFLQNETWSGVILGTGDTKIEYLTIEPGTIILVEENQNDQMGGGESTVDPVNPHEFLGADYAMTHTSIQVIERLTAKGTPENPLIFTSTA